MDDSHEQGEEKELYNQHGVYHGNKKHHFSLDNSVSGTLTLVEVNGRIFIDWKPTTEANVELDTQESDWAMVNTHERKQRTLSSGSDESPTPSMASTCLVSEVHPEIGESAEHPCERPGPAEHPCEHPGPAEPRVVESPEPYRKRRRRGHRVTHLGSGHGSGHGSGQDHGYKRSRHGRRPHLRSLPNSRHGRRHSFGHSERCGERFRIALSKVGSFRLNRHGKTVSLKLREERLPTIFFTFSSEGGKAFIFALCNNAPAIKHRRDQNLYMICQDNEKEYQHRMLARSFSELQLDKNDPTVWALLGKIRENPYEAAMGAFSKLTETFLYGRTEERPEAASELLTASMTRESPEDVHSESEDYVAPPSQTPVSIDVDSVICVPRGSPLTMERWTQGMDAEGRITDPRSIKELIFRGGIAENLRPEVWKFILGVYPWDSTHAERVSIREKKVKEYFTMKRQWETMTPGQEERHSEFRDKKSLIGKDVHRTDRALEFFAGDDNPNLESLMHILMTYVMYNFDLGYVQGMSDLLAPLLELFNNEVDAFWCFVGFMDRVGSNFDMDQEGMKQQLLSVRTLIALIDPALLKYFDKNDSGNMFFCFRWLIVLFKREFSRLDVMRLWEVLWSDLPCKNFQLLLCVAVLETEKHVFYENDYSFTEILKHVNELSMHINLEDMLSKAVGIHRLLIEKEDELPDCVREIIGLPPLRLCTWTPSPVPSLNDPPRRKHSNEHLPQTRNHAGSGEPGTSGGGGCDNRSGSQAGLESSGSDCDRESSIEILLSGADAEESFEKALTSHYF